MGRKRKTSERGLGYAHQKARREMPPPEGWPCPYCQEPMWPDQQLDLDHALARALAGGAGPLRWAHSSCNRRSGAQLGNRIRHDRKQVLRGMYEPTWLERWS